jgi:hypothetical protein
LAVAGKKSASKAEMIAEIKARFPKIKWPKPASLEEHVADAVSSIVSCLDHPVIIATKKMMNDSDYLPTEKANLLAFSPRS